MELPLRDRFLGCLLGLATGDALGAPVEFMARDAIQRIHGEVRDMEGGGWLELRPGQVTDDTEMMVCIADSLVMKKAFDPADVARRFVTWYRLGPRDIGHTTARAIQELASGTPWGQASRKAHDALKGRSASNGGLMRCAPLALLHYAGSDRLIEDTATSCCITHYDARATYAGAALNLIIDGCLRGLTVTQALKEARATIKPYQEEVANAIDLALGQPYDRPEVSGLAVDTLRAACRCFFHAATFEDALIMAVNLGGDTDTVGAVCGAMAGAYYGYSAVPERWLRVLESRDHLQSLALSLCRMSGAEAEDLRRVEAPTGSAP